MRDQHNQIIKVMKNLLSNIKKISENNNLAIDFDPYCGGYQLVVIGDDGGTSCAFGSSNKRMSKKEFIQYLTGLEAGLKFIKE